MQYKGHIFKVHQSGINIPGGARHSLFYQQNAVFDKGAKDRPPEDALGHLPAYKSFVGQ
jgi:hypothetical protein